MKVFRKLILSVDIPEDTREIITWHCWWNHFCWRLLLDSAIFWASHHLCFQMQKIQHYKYYQLNQSDIYALWYLAELSQHLHYTSTVNQEGKALHPLYLAAKLYKINLVYIYIKVDISVSVPVENGRPKKKKCLLLSFSHKIKWAKLKPRKNDKNNKS